MTDAAIVAEGIGKRFGPVPALEGVDLVLPAGGVLGLLGPNGAGKTTMVRVLATLLRPDRGRARVAGFDVAEQPQEVRRRIGLSGQYAAVDPFLSGQENLVMIGRLCGLPARQARRRAGDLIGQLGLAGAAVSWRARSPRSARRRPLSMRQRAGSSCPSPTWRRACPRWPPGWPPPGCTSARWLCAGPPWKKPSWP